MKTFNAIVALLFNAGTVFFMLTDQWQPAILCAILAWHQEWRNHNDK